MGSLCQYHSNVVGDLTLQARRRGLLPQKSKADMWRPAFILGEIRKTGHCPVCTANGFFKRESNYK